MNNIDGLQLELVGLESKLAGVYQADQKIFARAAEVTLYTSRRKNIPPTAYPCFDCASPNCYFVARKEELVNTVRTFTQVADIQLRLSNLRKQTP